MRFSLLCSALCLTLIACGESPAGVADPRPQVATSGGGERAVRSVTGSGHRSTAGGGQRIFSFSAVVRPDGSASGRFELMISDPVAGSENPAVLTIIAEVTCVSTLTNYAWVGGVVTASSNPDFIGGQTGWSVKDDGTGPGSQDLISLITIPDDDPGHAQAICDREVPRSAIYPIESGSVRVDFADWEEDFSDFADGVLPTSSDPWFNYFGNDASQGVSVQVAASSGALTRRPLVLTKEDGSVPGAPNFRVTSTRGRLVDISTGTLHLSADIQVNGGTFCSFFTVRAPTSAVASVALHDLRHEVGVPFNMEFAMDLDAGTISAKQDGIAVPVAVGDGGTRTVGETLAFPYLPFGFGFEGCFLFEQSFAVDNMRIGWSRR